MNNIKFIKRLEWPLFLLSANKKIVMNKYFEDLNLKK
jgi:hypothetical protein